MAKGNHAEALSHDGGGPDLALAEERRRQGLDGRAARRDRYRQGDDGNAGARQRSPAQDSDQGRRIGAAGPADRDHWRAGRRHLVSAV